MTDCKKWVDHKFKKLVTGEEHQYQCVHCQMVVNGAWFDALPSEQKDVWSKMYEGLD